MSRENIPPLQLTILSQTRLYASIIFQRYPWEMAVGREANDPLGFLRARHAEPTMPRNRTIASGETTLAKGYK